MDVDGMDGMDGMDGTEPVGKEATTHGGRPSQAVNLLVPINPDRTMRSSYGTPSWIRRWDSGSAAEPAELSGTENWTHLVCAPVGW